MDLLRAHGLPLSSVVKLSACKTGHTLLLSLHVPDVTSPPGTEEGDVEGLMDLSTQQCEPGDRPASPPDTKYASFLFCRTVDARAGPHE